MSASGPLVSFVMPVWRPRADWLHAAVDSVLGQTGCRLELLVVDDGNETPVADVLADVPDRRLLIVRVPHGGVSRARNAALEVVHGDYVRFVDADDVCTRRGTELLLARSGARQDVIAYGTTLVCDEELRPLWKMPTRQEGDAAVDSLLARFNVRPGGMMWPRQVIERVGGFYTELGNSEDWDFLQRALDFAPVTREPSVVHLYRRHGASITGNIEGGRQAARTIVDRYFERHPEQRGTALERRAEAMLDATSARVYATHGQPRAALHHARRAIMRDPLAFGNELAQARAAAWGRLSQRLRPGARRLPEA